MLINERDFNEQSIIETAKKMALAARTAPRSRGIENMEIYVAYGDEIKRIADKMDEIGIGKNQAFFIRDSKNVRNSSAILIIGVKIEPINLAYCGLCGMSDCKTKQTNPDIPCVFSVVNLGISVGSAVGVAMDSRIDNRIMYTIGMAIRDLRMLNDDIKIILGIPLSAEAKNIYFDRK